MRQHKIKNLMRYLISMRHFFCRFSCGKRGKAYKIQMFVDFRKKKFLVIYCAFNSLAEF